MKKMWKVLFFGVVVIVLSIDIYLVAKQLLREDVGNDLQVNVIENDEKIKDNNKNTVISTSLPKVETETDGEPVEERDETCAERNINNTESVSNVESIKIETQIENAIIDNSEINENIQTENIIESDNILSSENITNNNTSPNFDKVYEEDTVEIDTDGDGLVDSVEILFGTDRKQEDSDFDGLTDFVEINVTLTNPLKGDSDDDGIEDAILDIEGDGVNNQEEMFYNTNPISSDTDGDNLTDYEEINLYGTNACRIDSDEDGLNDYDEIILKFDPLLPDTDMNGILDSDEKIMQVREEIFDEHGRGITKVEVSINASGNIKNNVSINNIYEYDSLSSNVVGLIGVPIEINTKMPFETAIIDFYYDESMLGNTKEENLAILWYDEENSTYRMMDRDGFVDRKNNRVSCLTTHFSTYMLVDSQMWVNAWKENINYRSKLKDAEKSKYLDLVMVVDCSGSMEKGDKMSMTKSALHSFVNSIQGEDEMAIVGFTTTGTKLCNFTNDVPSLLLGISRLFTSGGTDIGYGLLEALELFKNRENDKQKVVVLVCDGDINYPRRVVDLYVEQSIPIYIVDLGNETSNYLLEAMARNTGGLYYYGKSKEQMGVNFGYVQEKTIDEIDMTDNDNDGLYDVFETAGMRLPNGQIIYTDPAKFDTDGDGLSDYEETGIIFEKNNEYIGIGYSYNIKYFMMRSDPTKKDTDGDGIDDAIDNHCWIIEELLVAHLFNKYSDNEYLKIYEDEYLYKNGGDQGWWSSEAKSSANLNYWDFASDKNYRLWKMGCGVIAVSDVEIYLAQQNKNYRFPVCDIAYNNNGHIQKDDYMNYVNYNSDLAYDFGGGLLYYLTGLLPQNMEYGLERFLNINNHRQKTVTWAPYSWYGKTDEEELVLEQIETMLNNNLPVVFSYYTADKDEAINLYKELEGAKIENINDSDHETVTGHYMTIIGLYKYLDEKSTDYKHILKVTSWGKIFYIRYDEYCKSLNFFSNILRIH